MKRFYRCFYIFAIFILFPGVLTAQLQRPDTNFKILQFPPDKIPTVDGKTDDWAIVPESYAIGTDQLVDDSKNILRQIRKHWMSK